MKHKATKSEWITVKKSKIQGWGGFAKKDIPKGTRIIEYVGPKITKAQAEKVGDKEDESGLFYIFELNKRYDLDGNVWWNTAKNVNHSCNPNAEADNIGGHIWLVAIKNIKKSEEVTYDYNLETDEYKDHPCRCGSKKCKGYIGRPEKKTRKKKASKKKKR